MIDQTQSSDEKCATAQRLNSLLHHQIKALIKREQPLRI